MLISVILTTRNSSSYINNALDSLLNQTNQDFEVIIIDDASDDTLMLNKVIQTYLHRLNIFVVFNTIKNNASYTRNQGMSLATGNLISFHDADDIWYENKIEEISLAYEKITEKNKPFILYHDVNRVDLLNIDKHKASITAYTTTHLNNNIIDFILNDDKIIQTSSITINNLAKNLLSFNENLPRHQDIQFCIDAFSKNFNFYHMNIVLSYWIILDRKINAYNKGANINFCFNWLCNNKRILSNKNIYNYVGKVVYPIAIKEKHLLHAIKKTKYNYGVYITTISLYKLSILIFKKIISVLRKI